MKVLSILRDSALFLEFPELCMPEKNIERGCDGNNKSGKPIKKALFKKISPYKFKWRTK
jgi:hypothetical protein